MYTAEIEPRSNLSQKPMNLTRDGRTPRLEAPRSCSQRARSSWRCASDAIAAAAVSSDKRRLPAGAPAPEGTRSSYRQQQAACQRCILSPVATAILRIRRRKKAGRTWASCSLCWRRHARSARVPGSRGPRPNSPRRGSPACSCCRARLPNETARQIGAIHFNSHELQPPCKK